MVLDSTNATVGGTDPQDDNVIAGNGEQGVLIEPGSLGQPGSGEPDRRGRTDVDGFYFAAGNGAEGVLIESSGTAGDPSSIVYSSSNSIGGAVAGAGNIISANGSDGVHIEGVGATRNLVEGELHRRGARRRLYLRQRRSRQSTPTACGSTTRPITRSADRRRATAT